MTGHVQALKELVHKLGNALMEIEGIAQETRTGRTHAALSQIRQKALNALELKIRANVR